MINLKELQIFLAAAENGSFSEAGRQMHLSQSAVSQMVNSLERQFGTILFDRSGRSIRLTEAGQALLPMARELLATANHLEETMLSMQEEVAGQMIIGCSTASGKYLLPLLIANFRKTFPKVRIDVHIASRQSVINKVVEGAYALGVSSKKIDHADLEYQDFFTDEIVLVVAKNHPWARFPKVYPDDLSDEPIILREDAAGTLEVLYQGMRQHDISPDMLKVAMVLGNAEAIAMAVEEGIGIAFISRLAAARSLADGRLVEVEVVGMKLSRKLFMARNQRLPASRAQQEFWNFVQNYAGQTQNVIQVGT
jgi:DNA-binding transcriptional LysR family regulator